MLIISQSENRDEELMRAERVLREHQIEATAVLYEDSRALSMWSVKDMSGYEPEKAKKLLALLVENEQDIIDSVVNGTRMKYDDLFEFD